MWVVMVVVVVLVVCVCACVCEEGVYILAFLFEEAAGGGHPESEKDRRVRQPHCG